MLVKNNLLVIRTGSLFETKGFKWVEGKGPVNTTGMQKPHLREGWVVPVKATGMQKPQKNCGNLWKAGPSILVRVVRSVHPLPFQRRAIWRAVSRAQAFRR